ncbi:hypothetical protein V6N13_060635 [Hibiscus sabdariffa]|uniref:Cupin type-1 domain-containing protein n=1 Tax=Hibiscus sabdariffa TaxID=183260 RepID=A0ABR2P7H7_9ROSI
MQKLNFQAFTFNKYITVDQSLPSHSIAMVTSSSRSFFIVLLFSLVLSFGLLCSAADPFRTRTEEDPRERYRDCRRRCERETRGEREQDRCEERCDRKFRQEQEEKEGGRRRLGSRFEECQQWCQQQGQRQQLHCQQQCRREFQEEREGEHQSHNPYYFPRRRYAQARFQEDNGNFWVLQKFADKSRFLKGINEYRIALIEANPNTFALPHHCDAEKIYVVTNGKGTLTFVSHKKKESFNLVPGVVIRVPAGSTVYLVNQDNNEKLTIAVILRPVNNPGQFEEFFPAGQENPQSYYRSFSREILEAVFNTQSEQLDRLFHGRQRQSQQGMFRRASQEQIRSLSQGATTPSEKEERFAFNLLAQEAKFSNQNGKFFEASPHEFELLRDVDTSILDVEINQGSICAPHYHSESTFVILVTEGKGYTEMVTPEEEEEERRSGEYRKVRAGLSPGDIFVVPAGHPVTFVASQNQKLRFLAFGLNYQNDLKIFIGGKDNLVRQMDSAAKELAFGVPSNLVDEIFDKNPQESYFVSGQRQQRDLV